MAKLALTFDKTNNPAPSIDNELADRALVLKRAFDDAKTQLDMVKAELRELAAGLVGPHQKSVKYKGQAGEVRVTWAESYRDVPVGEDGEQKRKIEAAIGAELVAELFDHTLVVLPKRGADMPAMLTVLCDAGVDAKQWFNIAEVLRAHPGFAAKAGELGLTDLAGEITAAPKVYIK